MKNAIRLTNQTARALRKQADQMRSACLVAAVIFSLAMAGLAVFLGLRYLPAAPIIIVCTAIVDSVIVMRMRAAYLSMIAQAICTEAAAREIRAGASESQRRQKAITDLINVKADAQNVRAPEKKEGKKPFFEPDAQREGSENQDEDEDLHAGNTMKIRPVQQKEKEGAGSEEKEAPRRRRRKDGLKLIRSEQAR